MLADLLQPKIEGPLAQHLSWRLRILYHAGSILA